MGLKKPELACSMTAVSLVVASLMLSSCASLDREYRLQRSEKFRVLASSQLKKRRPKTALKYGSESVQAAGNFGDSDFRLGVSLCLLGDTQVANRKIKEAQASYKESIRVLSKAERKLSEQLSRNNKPDPLSRLRHKLVVEDLAISLGRLGDLYMNAGKGESALKCYQNAADKYKSIVSPDLPAAAAAGMPTSETSASERDLILEQEYILCLGSLAQAALSAADTATAEEAYRLALSKASTAAIDESKRKKLRDDYLKLLRKLGKQDSVEARKLAADLLYSQYTVDGKLALIEGDHTAAELAFRKAFQESGKSYFAEQRVLRSLFNLISVFVAEGKHMEIVNCDRIADSFMNLHPNQNEAVYDEIQETLSNYYYVTNNFVLAQKSCAKQLRYRAMRYGTSSKELCSSYAQMGLIDYKIGDRRAAEQFAMAAYRIIQKNSLDRSFFFAISQTAELALWLDRNDVGEELYHRLIDIKRKRRDDAELDVVMLKTRLFQIYQSTKNYQKAKKLVDEELAVMSKASPEERAIAFPYLVMIIAGCNMCSWYDLSESMARGCRRILYKDMGGVFPNDIAQLGWRQSTKTLKEATGKNYE